MPLRFTIAVDGEKIVDRTLSRLTGVIEDWSDAWPAVERQLVGDIEKQFSSQGQYGSGGWKPLSEGWLTFKQNTEGYSTEIGTATGRMRKSLTFIDDSEHVSVGTKDQFVFGSTVPYLTFFSKARPAVQLPESSRRDLTRALQAFAMAAVD